MSRETHEGLVVKVSAPGKVILHGEHSVVYGKLAIASSLGLRTTIILEENKRSTLEIDFQDLNLQQDYNIEELQSIFKDDTVPVTNDSKYSWTHPESIDHDKFLAFIKKSLRLNEDNFKKNEYLSLLAFFYLYFGILVTNNIPIEGLSVKIKTDLSLGAGTGSSASLMVSLTGTFMRYLTTKMPNFKLSTQNTKVTDNFVESELKLISNWAYCAEKIIHGNPSGIDNTICTFGSMVSFRKGVPSNNIKTGNDILGILVDTKVPKNTGFMVKKVADLKAKHPKVVDSILESMDEIANEAMEYFVCLGMLETVGGIPDIVNCYSNLNELADINHNLLRSLNVSHPALDDVVQILASKELHGKITGSGGGGYVIALIPPHLPFNELDVLCHELSLKGYQPLITKLGGAGVMVEHDCE